MKTYYTLATLLIAGSAVTVMNTTFASETEACNT